LTAALVELAWDGEDDEIRLLPLHRGSRQSVRYAVEPNYSGVVAVAGATSLTAAFAEKAFHRVG
jgi:hypothetical protein